jgi:acetolactate synthase-1/2/3 large subunit
VSSEDEIEPALEEAIGCGRAAVVDARVDPEEKCFPMIPAGAAALEVIECPDEEVVEA